MDKRLMWILPGLLILTAACSINFDPQRFSGSSNTVRGSGKVVTETRNVSGFDEVSLTGSGELTIQVGDQESLTIEAEDNLLPLIISEVKGSRLELGFKPNISVNDTKPVRYHLIVKSLKAVSLLGSGSINASDLTAGSFTLSLIGSGNVSLQKVDFKSLDAKISGSGNVQINGTAETQAVSIPGSGEYRAPDLQSQMVNASISGSGTITVWAAKSLDAHIQGSGTIGYYGSPQVSQKVSGSGNVRPLGSK